MYDYSRIYTGHLEARKGGNGPEKGGSLWAVLVNMAPASTLLVLEYAL